MTAQKIATDSKTTPFSVELVSGPTAKGGVDDFELLHARRVLALLKSRLGRQGLLDLLAADIDDGSAFLREKALLSNGQFRAGTVRLAIRGLKAAQFMKWLVSSFDDETVLLAAEPDHFVVVNNPDSTVTLVENLGPFVCKVQLPAYGTAPNWAAEAAKELLPEAEYPFRRLADLTLADGTVVGRVMTQFGDTDEGFNAVLSCYFPVECPEEVLEHHRQHLAVEFRNWITAAAAAR